MAFRIKSQINIPGLQQRPSQSGPPLHLISSATKFQVRCPFSHLTCHAHSCCEPLHQLFPLQSIHPLPGAWLDSSCHSALNGGLPWPQCQGSLIIHFVHTCFHSLHGTYYSFVFSCFVCLRFVLLWISSEAETETKVWMQIVYLDNVARKQGR